MRQLRLEPAVWEEGPNREAYASLSSELAAQGWTVIQPRAAYEERSGGALPTTLTALAIHLAQHAEDGVLDLLVVGLLRHLKRPRRGGSPRPIREAVIYGPDN